MTVTASTISFLCISAIRRRGRPRRQRYDADARAFKSRLSLTRSGTLQIADDVGHAGLVAQEGGHVNWLGCIILREGLDFAAMTGSTLARQEAERAVAGSLELAVRLKMV